MYIYIYRLIFSLFNVCNPDESCAQSELQLTSEMCGTNYPFRSFVVSSTPQNPIQYLLYVQFIFIPSCCACIIVKECYNK